MKCSTFLVKANAHHSLESRLISSLGARRQLPKTVHNNEPTRKPIGFSIRSFYSGGKHQKEKTIVEKYAAEAKELSRRGLELQDKDNATQDVENDDAIGEAEEKQARTPWHREGPEYPPVRKVPSAGVMTRGKLLTTPSHLLKLILPLTTHDKHSGHKHIEPLALLVHPHQPLSYLERLIQSELPMIKNKQGEEKIPLVWFRAEDSTQEDQQPNPDEVEDEDVEVKEKDEGTDEQIVDGKLIKTGKLSSEAKSSLKHLNIAKSMRGGPGEGGVETYSGLGHETSKPTKHRKFVRWSSSTEIGDFIRDAARGREFAVEIEGRRKEIRVGVPSFGDRTHYLRVRLRKTAKQLDGMAQIKKECDELAHKSAQRLAMGGFGILVAWWASIYHFTFRTDYGWDTMEPITYLAGLSTIMIGYLYFLWHNREVSYRSALHLTVTHRQNQLYTMRGFDVSRWETLVEEANALRKEIKKVADEYDVEWDEIQDEESAIVHKALREERKKKERARTDEEEEEEVEEEEETKGKEKGNN